MSELQPENRPNAAEHMDEAAFEPISLMRTIGERTAHISQFFRTEIGAFSLLQTIAQEQEKTVATIPVRTNQDGIWRFYPAVDYNPDFADSSQRRILGITIHTKTDGDVYPRLSVRTQPDHDPVELYERYELLIATAALRGQLLKLPDNTDIISTLMGPPSEKGQVLFDRQQRYVQWVERLAKIVDIPRTKRMHQFVPIAIVPSAN